MLSDARGVFGGLSKGHERDRQELSDDVLFKRFQSQDVLWDSSEMKIRKELGLASYDNVPSEAERLRRALAKGPDDLAYSSYHRHSQLGVLLRSEAPQSRWNPLEGIDRYWHEHKAEALASGDFENKRLSDTPSSKEGHVRIIVPHTETGYAALGLGMVGLTVVHITDPKAYHMGWRLGDQVLSVNRVPVADEMQFQEVVTRAISRNRLEASPLLFDVWREPARSVHHGPLLGGVPMGMAPSPLPPNIMMSMGHPASFTDQARAGHHMVPGASMTIDHARAGHHMVPGASMTIDPAGIPRPPMIHGLPQMSASAPWLQQQLVALSQENAFLRRQLGEGHHGVVS